MRPDRLRARLRTRRPRPALRLGRLTGGLPEAAAGDAEGRRDRHHARPGPGQGEERAVRPGLHHRGLRRPAAPPPARGLLGQRQPRRAAQRLRRGQTLRRGADHRLPPQPRRRHRHRAHLQHLRAPDAPARRPRHPHLHPPGAGGRAADGRRGRHPDPLDLLRRRHRRGRAGPGLQRARGPGQHRQRRRDHHPGPGPHHPRPGRLAVVDPVRPAPRRRPQRALPGRGAGPRPGGMGAAPGARGGPGPPPRLVGPPPGPREPR